MKRYVKVEVQTPQLDKFTHTYINTFQIVRIHELDPSRHQGNRSVIWLKDGTTITSTTAAHIVANGGL